MGEAEEGAPSVTAEARLVVAGALGWLALNVPLVVACSPSAEQLQAASVAQCVARVAADIPPGALLPRDPVDYTLDDLVLAAAVVDGLRACHALRAPAEDAGPW